MDFDMNPFKAQKDLIFYMVLKFVVSKQEKVKDYP
jgi:hypothetical protein